MSFVNFMSREINCKVVYCGPGLSGRTTNMKYIHDRTNPEHRGRLISLATEIERTLFLDVLIPGVLVRTFRVRLQLYTVPGAAFTERNRRQLLKGCDGIVYVADSQVTRREANLEYLEDLSRNLETHGLSLDQVPLVFQYNKRDLPEILPVEQLRSELNPSGRPDFEAVASQGKGVFDTLKGCCGLLLDDLSRRYPSTKPS